LIKNEGTDMRARTQGRIAARLAPAKSEWFFSLRVKESMRELSMFGIVGEEKR